MTTGDLQEISIALRDIRVLRHQRNICMAPFFSVFLVGIPLALANNFAPGVVSAIWHSSWFSVVWGLLWVGAIVGFLLSFPMEWRLGSVACPKCQKSFHAGPSPRWGVLRNSYTRKCLNCGLRLDGGNIGEV
jgi:hypothetical protein